MSSDPPASAGTQHAPGEAGGTGTLPGAPVVPPPVVLPVVLPLVPGFVRPPAEWRPLPDAVAVRLLAIPDSAPPYDDELGTSQRPCQASAEPLHDGLLPDERPGRGGQVAPGGRPPQHQPAAAGSPARAPAAPPGWPSQFAQGLAETLAGSRPPRQIAAWTTERTRRHIQRLGPLLAAGEQPRVRRVVTFRPATDVVEMTVIIGVGPRVRALAIRLERDGPRAASPGRDAQAARWVCTAVEAA